MADEENFDEFPHIEYRTISKLFWNEFPYKVLVVDSIPRPQDRIIGSNPLLYREWQLFHQEQRRLYNKLHRSCSDDVSAWKAMKNGIKSFSFFFKSAEDAKAFIKKNKKLVTVVFRPENSDQITALDPNRDRKRKLILRDFLYYPSEKFAGYRYCIEFHEKFNKAEEDRLDDTILQQLFNGRKDKRRYYYTISKRRRLYLTKENDIFYVILGLFDDIRCQTEVLLKNEISK